MPLQSREIWRERMPCRLNYASSHNNEAAHRSGRLRNSEEHLKTEPTLKFDGAAGQNLLCASKATIIDVLDRTREVQLVEQVVGVRTYLQARVLAKGGYPGEPERLSHSRVNIHVPRTEERVAVNTRKRRQRSDGSHGPRAAWTCCNGWCNKAI